MFNPLFGRIRILVPDRMVKAVKNVATELGFVRNELLLVPRSFSSSLNGREDEQKQRLGIASYLINTCGLSPESAESAAKKIYLKTTENPNAVIRLFRDYGFVDAHISKIVEKEPQLLLANPKKTLLPKIEFLLSIGVTKSDLSRMISWDPGLLIRSLEHHLLQCHKILKSILLCDEKVVKALRRLHRMAMQDLPKTLVVNISVLSRVGMPESIISWLVTTRPCLACLKSNKFTRNVNKVVEIGFAPSKHAFVDALQLISFMSNKTWTHKMEVYKRWGLSEDEIWSAFKRYPMCMIHSEEKLMDKMDFLVNKMGWQPAAFVRVPAALNYSLEKWIVPRCSVIKVLQLKGLVKQEIGLSSVLVSSDRYFLDSFVIKYQEKVPELFSIFRNKTSITDRF